MQEFFLILLAEIVMIFALGWVIFEIACIFQWQVVEEGMVLMRSDFRHNGWLLVILIAGLIWTGLGWNAPGPSSPIEVHPITTASKIANDSGMVAEVVRVSNNPLAVAKSLWNGWPESEQNPTWSWWHKAKIISWLICILSLFWVFSDDILRSMARVIERHRQRTSGAGAVVGQAPVATAPASPAGGNAGGGQMSRRDWQRWLSPRWLVEYLSDDVVGEVIADFMGKRITGLFSR
jgi:hypothetical protein